MLTGNVVLARQAVYLAMVAGGYHLYFNNVFAMLPVPGVPLWHMCGPHAALPPPPFPDATCTSTSIHVRALSISERHFNTAATAVGDVQSGSCVAFLSHFSLSDAHAIYRT